MSESTVYNVPYVVYMRDHELYGVWHDKGVYPWQLPAVTARTREAAIKRYREYMGWANTQRTDFTTEDWT